MIVPMWFWLVFTFVTGCCIGSFLNVVIYRMPIGKSLVSPPSACPACGTNIKFYDNIPLISWIVLKAKCRNCKAPISGIYFLIELLTGVIWAGLFYLYFCADVVNVPNLVNGGWLIYLLHVVMISALLAASAIDFAKWVIPIFICWFIALAAVIAAAVSTAIIDWQIIAENNLLPVYSSQISAAAAGAMAGLIITIGLLFTKKIKRSYDYPENILETNKINHRKEILKEVLFLMPPIIFAWAFVILVTKNQIAGQFWQGIVEKPVVTSVLGCFWGYLVGGFVVWLTRILGTLCFNKEAMGLGDVHLMAAAGAVIGAVEITMAFFIAPFFGLGWAVFQLIFKKTRQIPYGPFLSIGIVIVIILHERILDFVNILFNY